MEIKEWVIDTPACANLVSEEALSVLVCSIMESNDNGPLFDLYFMMDNRLDEPDLLSLKAALMDLLEMSGILDYVNAIAEPVVDCVVRRRTMAITVYG